MAAASDAPAAPATSRSLRADHIVVTGANGYIGRRLVELAVADGRAVTILGRSAPLLAPSIRYVSWQLGGELPILESGAGRTALVHLAHDWSDRDLDGVNQRGTGILLAHARQSRIQRFVFASSVSARAEALNAYGRIKWAIEQQLEGSDTVAARIGLVYGGAARGMYGLLLRLVSLTPVLPMVQPSRPVLPIHIDEVCRGLLAFADNDATGWKGLAAPEPISFAEFLKTLSREGFAASLMVPTVPLRLALAGASLAGLVPFAPRVDKERILGLAGTCPIDSKADLDALGLDVQPMVVHLRRSALGTKALLREGRVLCCYILRDPAPSDVIRRYVRAVRAVSQQARDQAAGPLALPRLTLAAPPLLRLYEPLRQDSLLTQRLRIATALAEWAPGGAPIGQCIGSMTAVFLMLWQVMLDIAVLPLRWWLGR
jgi:nucleoside-diphosphate-sugar epimerase